MTDVQRGGSVTKEHSRWAYEAGMNVVEMGMGLERMDEWRASWHAIAAGMALRDVFGPETAGTRVPIIRWATVKMAVDALDRARLEARSERAVTLIVEEQERLASVCEALDVRP